MEKIKSHKRNKFRVFRFYLSDLCLQILNYLERTMESDFNCIHGIITGVTMALMFIGALFL